MNLAKLFEAQKKLDERIIKEKGLQGQNLLPQKVLALIAELGECANEFRAWKFWSEDREPRVEEEVLKSCMQCGATGERFGERCRQCEGRGDLVVEYKNPLLEEYVDCLHFSLSLVIETHKGQKLPVHIPASRRLGERIETYFIEIAYSATAILRGNATANIMAAYETLGSVLGLGKALSFTDDQIEAAYFAKNRINHERQENSY